MHEKERSVTARLDAHCHMLSYTYWCIASGRTQRHTHRHAHTNTCAPYTLTHLASQEAMGPVGQSLRVWFVCLDLIIETGLFLQPLLRLFYILTRERGRERENKALTAFSHNGERLSHPLSTVTVCRLSVQHNRRRRGRGRASCVISPLILM